MSLSFANLVINRIIIHQVFERDENRAIREPKYSNALTTLDIEGLAVLQERIINALGNNSHSIEMEISNVSTNHTFQILAKSLYADDPNFISLSKNVAYKLAEAQTSRSIPGGVVVIFNGTVGVPQKKFIGVIKAEIHGGFVLDSANNVELLLKFLSQLLLTPQQKLYKIGFFIETSEPMVQNTSRRPDEFKAFVYDHNVNSAETASAAQYFFGSFLGCSVSPTNKKLTKDFYNDTKVFIDNLDIRDETKMDLNYALYTYLKISQSNTINVAEFADEYLSEDIKDNYCDYMSAKKFPTNAVVKDLTLIKSKLRRRKIKFSSDVSITAPSENFKELVEIIGYEGDKTTLRIQGRIEEQE